MATSKSGGYIEPQAPDDPAVGELEESRTLVLQPVAPGGPADDVEPRYAPTLSDVVKSFKPQLTFEETKRVDVTKGSTEAEKAEVTMDYGADNAARVLEDFSRGAVLGKAEAVDSPAEAGPLQRRPLLQGRLQASALEELCSRFRDEEFRKVLDDPDERAKLVAALDQEIEGVNEQLEDIRKVEAVEGAYR